MLKFKKQGLVASFGKYFAQLIKETKVKFSPQIIQLNEAIN